MKLFREEAINSLAPKLEGKVLISQTKMQTRLIKLTLLAFIIIMLTAFFGSYAKKISASGYVSTTKGIVQLHPSRKGVVSDILVNEGDFVEEGQVVANINYEVNTIENTTADKMYLQSALEGIEKIEKRILLNKKIHESKLSQLSEKIATVRSQIKILNSRQLIFKKKLEEEQTKLASYETLLSKSYISQKNYDLQAQKYDSVKEYFDGVSLELLTAKIRLEELEAKFENSPLENDLYLLKLQEQIANLELRKIEIEYKLNSFIVAPVSGVITSIQYSQGQNLLLNRPITTIIPENSAYMIELFLSANYLGRIKKGSKVFVKYTAFPYQIYGVHQGTIVETSKYIANKEDSFSTLSNEPTFRLKVELEKDYLESTGTNIPLTPGMTVSAEIIQEERPLWAWLFLNLKGLIK